MAGLTRQLCLLTIRNRPCLLRHAPKTSKAFQLGRSFNTRAVRFAEDKMKRPEGIGDSYGASKKSQAGKGKGPVTWANFGMACLVLALSWGGWQFAVAKKEAKQEKERKREIGKSLIGGKFELVDQDGKTRTSEDFHGKWVLLYFGFTHCPDICPDEMEKLAEVYDKLTAKSKDPKTSWITEPVPLFITVDPGRDGVKEVGQYVKEFHPKFIGLTGSAEKVKEACKAYRVYFSAGPKSEDDDYIVDHTIIIYLIGPDGQFCDYYGQNKTSDDIVTSALLQMGKYHESNKPGFIKSLVS